MLGVALIGVPMPTAVAQQQHIQSMTRIAGMNCTPMLEAGDVWFDCYGQRASGSAPRQIFVAIAIWRAPQGIGAYVSDGKSTGSKREAEQNALARCHKYTKTCELLGWAANQCMVLAVSDKSDIGLAYHVSRKTADFNALEQCSLKNSDCYLKAEVCANDYPQR